jgi:predicted ATP-dependent endonuclease of OLD family
MSPVLDRISITGFRAARNLELRPTRLCALVGEASSGKSTVLTAIWMLLESGAPVPAGTDLSHGAERVHVEAESGDRAFFLDARPPASVNLNREGAPPVLFFPASLRSAELVAPPSHRKAARAAALLHSHNGTSGGVAVIDAIERLLDARARGILFLVEEPELYLSPQAQRHLYRLLRVLSERGNQVIYTTHAATFLSVTHLHELALVRHRRGEGTTLWQPEALPADESFRALAEVDAERAEVFLSRAALLVEGMTEKLAFQLVFRALGREPDREAIAILECGGKANIPLFARICNACAIPYVVVYDRDAPLGEVPNESEQVVNAAIEEVAGPGRTIQLVPDFERIAGLKSTRNRKKPAKAYRRFSHGRPVPPVLARAVERVVARARGEEPGVRGSAPPRPAPVRSMRT